MRQIILTALVILVIAYLFIAYDYLFSQSLLVDDPLTDYKTVGIQHEGSFTPEGWKTTDELSYIQYNVPTTNNATVEFDVKGLYASNVVFPNCDIDKYGNKNCSEEDVHYQLVNFWDRDDNNSWWGKDVNGITMWHNPWKMVLHIYGYVLNDVYKWRYVEHRLNVCAFSGGYEDDSNAFGNPPLFGPFDWQQDKTYHHKLTWGAGHFKWYMDDVLIVDRDYSSFGCEYAPPFFSIRLGSAVLDGIKSGGLKCPVGIIYSNFKMYENEDILILPEVVDIEVAKEEDKISTTSDFLIHFNKVMDLVSVRDNLAVYPSFNYELKQIGNSVCVRNTDILQSNTFYSLSIGANTNDGENNLGSDYVYTFQTNKSYPDTLYLYESHDFPVSGVLSYNSAFVGVFTNGEREIILDGFWDNYNTGKVRFAPDRVGTWNYNINGTTGTFICVNSNSKGFITTDGTRFKYSNGEEWKWIGNTVWRGYTSLMPYSSRWKEIINLCSAHDYTAVQSIVHSYINGNIFWSNEGGACFGGGSTPDYNNLNPEYFRWIDRRINYSLSKDVVPVIFMTWVQDYGEFSSSQFDKYVRYIVSRYAAKNVIWIICGEYQELVNDFAGRTTDEFNTSGMLVHQKDPYNHPTSLHPTGRSSTTEFGSSVWMDFIGQQTPYSSDVVRDLTYGKPVVVLEPRYYYPDEFEPDVPNTEVIKQLYETVNNGGYYVAGFYTYYAPDKGNFNLSALPDEQQWTRNLNKLVKDGAMLSLEEIIDYVPEPVLTVPSKVKNLRIIK